MVILGNIKTTKLHVELKLQMPHLEKQALYGESDGQLGWMTTNCQAPSSSWLYTAQTASSSQCELTGWQMFASDRPGADLSKMFHNSIKAIMWDFTLNLKEKENTKKDDDNVPIWLDWESGKFWFGVSTHSRGKQSWIRQTNKALFHTLWWWFLYTSLNLFFFGTSK